MVPFHLYFAWPQMAPSGVEEMQDCMGQFHVCSRGRGSFERGIRVMGMCEKHKIIVVQECSGDLW